MKYLTKIIVIDYYSDISSKYRKNNEIMAMWRFVTSLSASWAVWLDETETKQKNKKKWTQKI